uniref:Uncharacterized protein n=1 Tax=Amphimedon queenslandica TaxID=400682 RepID=A0A1X7U4P8_AMPQE
MEQIPTIITDHSFFVSALRQFPMVEDVADYNTDRLLECGYPIAEIKAVHTGANAIVLMMLVVWIHL